MKKKLPHQTKPCKSCPFRKTNKGFLGEDRITDILNQDSFVCHLTLATHPNKPLELKQCAGHMHLAERNIYVIFAEFLEEDLKLIGRDLVFDTVEDCIKHHSKN